MAEQVEDVKLPREVEIVSRIQAVPSMLEVICRTTGMGFAAIAQVTDKKWVACAVRDEIEFGLIPGGELQLETTICHEIRQRQQAVIIDHVAEDPQYAKHHTPAMYGFQSYISVPIKLKTGEFFGTLCAIDPRPAKLNNPETIGMFTLFADLIAFHLEALSKLDESESRLQEERETAELREQFIAILGHDLRNPVGATLNAAQILLRMPVEQRVQKLASIVQDSAYRMKGLIDNILDFARGRLGDGIRLNKTSNEPLSKVIDQVVEELRVIWPHRVIETHINLPEVILFDGPRIAQLISNLLANALTHGTEDLPVKVRSFVDNNSFTLSVTNSGEKIPDAVRERLFQPFYRGETGTRQQGLGLGLYIASEIARAHGGILQVISTEDETTFSLKIPVA